MNHHIGILEKNKYLASVLEQCNLVYETFSSAETLYASDLPVVFCDEPCEADTDCFLFTNHQSLAAAKHITNIEQSGFYFAMEDVEFGTRSFLIDIPCFQYPITLDSSDSLRGTVFDRQNRPLQNTGILFSEQLISLPFILCNLNLGEQLSRRPYYSKTAQKHFVEIGPAVDFAALRRLLFSLIQYAYLQLKLPIPLEETTSLLTAKKYFSVRIDADGCTKKSTEVCQQIAVATGCSFTWFLDMEEWKKHRHLIASLVAANQDIQLHCYHHMTYFSKKTNLLNLQRGLKYLKRNRINPIGVVSPFGFYTPGFADAISDLNMSYSSEFSYNVDDKPSYTDNHILQLPIHCGSIGTLQKYGFTDTEIFADFEAAVREAAEDGRVGIIYDHPVGRMEKYPSEFIALINKLKSDGFEYLNYTEYAQLWKEKRSIFNASLEMNRVQNLFIEDIAFVYPNESIMKIAYEDTIIQLREAAQTPLQYYLFAIKRKIAYVLGIR